jgi:hypothetical protein
MEANSVKNIGYIYKHEDLHASDRISRRHEVMMRVPFMSIATYRASFEMKPKVMCSVGHCSEKIKTELSKKQG